MAAIPGFLKNINWKDHLVNLVVVILGITIAFYLEGWRGAKADERLEDQYLMAIREDLKHDLEYLDTLMQINQEHLGIQTALSRASIQQPYTKDSLAYFMRMIQYSLPFTAQMTTYESMKFSGRVEIIGDFNLRNRIVELYEQYYRGMRQYDEAVHDHLTRYIQPFSIQELVYTGSNQLEDDFLHSNRFRNMIFPYLVLSQERLRFYRITRSAISDVLNEIEKNQK